MNDEGKIEYICHYPDNNQWGWFWKSRDGTWQGPFETKYQAEIDYERYLILTGYN